MPEILRVIARLNRGGPARHVMRIDAPLRALGFRTTLVTGQVGRDEQDLTEQARAAGLDVLQLPGLGREPRVGADLAALAALRRLLAERRPALLHTHTAKAGALGRLAAVTLRSRPARVHTFHGHVLSGYFDAPVASLVAGTERLLARATTRLVAVSARVRDDLLRRGVGRPEQWDVVPTGIDLERTRPDPAAGADLRRSLGCAEDAVLVGLVGRLAAVKDPALAVRAFLARRSEHPAHLLVMGDGALGPEVRAALAGRNDASWLPPRDELGAVWGALDLCLMSSRNEGLPQVATEALAAGVPVLAPDVGGLGELVRSGYDGLLVPHHELGAALDALLSDPARLAGLRRGAQGFDPAPHAASAVAAGLAAVYARALGGRPGDEPALEAQRPSGHAAAPCGS